MKKIFCLIAALIFIGACDDGDMSFKTFDFSDTNLQDCTEDLTYDTYYKITGTEGLILELTPGVLSKEVVVDSVSGEVIPQIITLSGTARLTYYNYVAAPESGLCTVAEIPKASETWTGSGRLSVITRPNYKNNILVGYYHTITMENVSFNRDGETITINNSVFGDVKSDFDFTFNFKPSDTTEPVVDRCDSSATSLYTVKSDEILMLSVPNLTSILPSEQGEQTLTITDEDDNVNRIIFTIYDGTITEGNICAPPEQQPLTPKAEDRWEAISGTIIIKTTLETGPQYAHKIYLKDVIFSNITTDETFNVKDITVTEEDGTYLFGTWTTTP